MTEQTEHKYDVFVSYSKADRSREKALEQFPDNKTLLKHIGEVKQGLGEYTIDVRCWVLNIGYWVLGAGGRLLGAGRAMKFS